MTSEENKKTNFTSKYLSPCRTIGLKRKSKSPGSLFQCKKSSPDCDVIPSGTAENDANINGENQLCLPLTPKSTPKHYPSSRTDEQKENQLNSSELQIPGKVDSSNAIQHSLNRKVIKSNHSIKNNSERIDSTSNDSKTKLIDQTLSASLPKEIVNKIITINNKYQKLKHLKNNKIYSDKHNMTELKELTEKWRKACIETLLRLHCELRERGDLSTSLGDLITSHSIPPDLISFNMETQDFI